MIRTILLALLAAVCTSAGAQDQYNREITAISTDLHSQLVSTVVRQATNAQAGYTVALVGIETEDGGTTKLTDLLETELALDLSIKGSDSYQVLDRTNILKLLEEKRLPKVYGNKRDFARQLGRIKAAQIMVVGKLVSFDAQYRLLFTIMETGEGRTLSGSRGTLTATQLLREKNQQKGTAVIPAAASEAPVVANTGTNSNPTQVDANCATRNTGAIYVENKTSHTIEVSIRDPNRQDGFGARSVGYLTLGPRQADWVRSAGAGTFNYSAHIREWVGPGVNDYNNQDNYRVGTISVITCQEARITIR